jgi:hypothetical protein
MTAEDIRLKGGLPARVQVLPKPVNLPWLQGFLSALVAQRRLSAQAAAPAPAAGPRPA